MDAKTIDVEKIINDNRVTAMWAVPYIDGERPKHTPEEAVRRILGEIILKEVRAKECLEIIDDDDFRHTIYKAKVFVFTPPQMRQVITDIRTILREEIHIQHVTEGTYMRVCPNCDSRNVTNWVNHTPIDGTCLDCGFQWTFPEK